MWNAQYEHGLDDVASIVERIAQDIEAGPVGKAEIENDEGKLLLLQQENDVGAVCFVIDRITAQAQG